MKWLFFVLLATGGVAKAGATVPTPEQIAAYQALAAQDLRVATIGYRLASANAPFCKNKMRNPGWVLHSYRQYPDRDVAQSAFPFPTPLAISAIVPGGPADKAGLKEGYGLSDYPPPGGIWWGGELRVHKPSNELVETANQHIKELFATGEPLAFPFQSSFTAPAKYYSINPPEICASDFRVDNRAKVDAGADGEGVRVTSGLIEYVANDDELAFIIAHELAHNLLGHRLQLTAMKKNKNQATRATEIEADQLSVWLMANAGYDTSAALRFAERFGRKYGLGLFNAGTHPGWQIRVANMQAQIDQIAATKADNGSRTPPLISDQFEVRTQ